jgi:enamine deaminase RidA (YjgF/YER057c/UK114 family)
VKKPKPKAKSKSKPKPNTSIRHINPPALNKPSGYTHVVEATGRRTIYLSGQVAVDKDGTPVGAGDFRAQTVQAFENLRAGLAAAGAGFRDVVKATYYVLDMSNIAVLREVRSRYWGPAAPASTLVEVRRLAREEFLVEIEAIAVRAT